MNAVIYIRAYGEMKGTEVTQMTMVNNLVQQLDVTVVGHFISNDEIPVADLLLKISRDTNANFDTILTLNKDVISAKLQDVYNFVTECSSKGITVHTFGDGNLTDFFNSVGRFKAQKDKEQLSKLTTERMARLAVTGRQLGGRVPFGYRIGAGHTEIDKEKAPIVREVFLHFAQGFES